MVAIIAFVIMSLAIPFAISIKIADPLIHAFCLDYAIRNAKNWPSKKLFVITVIIFETICKVAFFMQMARIGGALSFMIFGELQ